MKLLFDTTEKDIKEIIETTWENWDEGSQYYDVLMNLTIDQVVAKITPEVLAELEDINTFKDQGDYEDYLYDVLFDATIEVALMSEPVYRYDDRNPYLEERRDYSYSPCNCEDRPCCGCGN